MGWGTIPGRSLETLAWQATLHLMALSCAGAEHQQLGLCLLHLCSCCAGLAQLQRYLIICTCQLWLKPQLGSSAALQSCLFRAAGTACIKLTVQLWAQQAVQDSGACRYGKYSGVQQVQHLKLRAESTSWVDAGACTIC